MRLYLGTPSCGWKMYGIGFKSKWYFGVFIRREEDKL